MSNPDRPSLGVVYPVSYRVTDHLTVPYVNLPSSVTTTPERILWWAADNHLAWLLVTWDRTWRDVLPHTPHHPGHPTYLRHLHYGDLHAFYAPTVDDLAMLPYVLDGRWWPSECVVCRAEVTGYDDCSLPHCDDHAPVGATPF